MQDWIKSFSKHRITQFTYFYCYCFDFLSLYSFGYNKNIFSNLVLWDPFVSYKRLWAHYTCNYNCRRSLWNSWFLLHKEEVVVGLHLFSILVQKISHMVAIKFVVIVIFEKKLKTSCLGKKSMHYFFCLFLYFLFSRNIENFHNNETIRLSIPYIIRLRMIWVLR